MAVQCHTQRYGPQWRQKPANDASAARPRMRGLGGVAQHRPHRKKNTQTRRLLKTLTQNRQPTEGESGNKKEGFGEEIVSGGGG